MLRCDTRLVAGLVLMLVASAAFANEPALNKGERIVFLGDSITQGGVAPNGYVTLVSQELAKRKPELEITVIGAGISGNRVPDLQNRLQRDVIEKKPTLVVIYIGINDVWHSIRGKGTPKPDFESGLRSIIAEIQKANARVILCTPSVIGEKHDGSNPLDELLDEYSDVSRKVAKDTGSQLLDLRKEFVSYLKEHNKENADKGVLTPDTVHLNAAGNKFVAQQMLAALGVNAAPPRLLRHMVLFKFKASVSADEVQEVVKAFAALPEKIDAIADFETGTDVSVENKADGFTHAFFVSFRDEQGRDAYLPHPAHQEFVKLVGPRLEKALVIDYWATSGK